MPGIITRIEKSLDSRRRGVTSTTLEEVGATDVMAINIPGADAKVRNVRRSLADGRAVLTFDKIDDNFGDSYTVSGTASQEPLATHPHFQADGKWAISDDEWKKWDAWQKSGADIANEPLTIYSEGFQKFVQLSLKGFTDYLQPRVTVRIVNAQSEAPNLDGLGKISTPSSAPTLPAGGNWLLSGVDAEKDLSVDESEPGWTVTTEYISSGPGGWNVDIYGQ